MSRLRAGEGEGVIWAVLPTEYPLLLYRRLSFTVVDENDEGHITENVLIK